jgi:hypothetical protein
VSQFAKVHCLLAALVFSGCAEQSGLTTQRQQSEDETTRLYNERMAAMQQAEKSYEDNVKMVANMYAHAQTPEQLQRANEFYNTVKEEGEKLDQLDQQQADQEYRQEVLDQLQEIKDRLGE